MNLLFNKNGLKWLVLFVPYKYVFVLFLFLGFAFIGHSNVQAQQNWQQKVDYDIHATLNDTTDVLHAYMVLTYHNNAPHALDSIYLHLWANALRSNQTPFAQQMIREGKTRFRFSHRDERGGMDSLNFKYGSQPLNHSFVDKHGEMLALELPKPLKSGDSMRIFMTFRMKIPKNFSRFGKSGGLYAFSQWYPKVALYDSAGWHLMPYLNQGEFFSDFGRYRVRINVPKDYVVAATGNLQNEVEKEWLYLQSINTRRDIDMRQRTERTGIATQKNGTKTLVYEQDNVHDFAWFANKRFYILQKKVDIPGREDPVKVMSFFPPERAKAFLSSPQFAEKALQYYSTKVGPYPYDVFSVVSANLPVGDGMEYPTLGVISGSPVEDITFHEVGHAWFQGILGTDERMHPFLDEGLTSFYDIRYAYENRGLEASIDTMDLAEAFVRSSKQKNLIRRRSENPMQLGYHYQARRLRDQPINLPADDYTPFNYNAIIYGKAANAFFYLFNYLGADVFDAVIQDFYQEWKFRHPGPADLRAAFERHSDKSLDWFFDDLLKTTKVIDYGVENLSSDLTTLTLQNHGGIASPVYLTLLKDNLVVYRRWLEGFEGEKFVDLPEVDFDKVVINPEIYVPELNYRNNYYFLKRSNLTKPLSVRPVFKYEQPDRWQLLLTPLLAANRYDGFMGGIGFTNSLLPPQKFNFLLAPMYAFGSEELVGTGKIRMQHFIESEERWNRITYGVSGRRFNYGRANGQDLNYAKISPYIRYQFQNKPIEEAQYLNEFYLRSVYVNREERALGRRLPSENPIRTYDYLINELTYVLSNSDVLRPFSLKGQLQAGTAFGKFMGTFNWAAPLFNNEKGFTLRLFTGAMIYNNSDREEFQLHLSNQFGISDQKRAFRDYMYDETLFARSDNTGLFAYQTFENNGNFKIQYSNVNSNAWMVALNLEAKFPGYIPLIAFLDVGTYEEQLQEETAALYVGGLGLTFFDGAFKLYMPLAYSNQFSDYYELNRIDWPERVQFMLNLNLYNPVRVIDNLEDFF